jgi:hypothetical protein
VIGVAWLATAVTGALGGHGTTARRRHR